MPNTLAHIGIQGLVTRRVIKDSDYKWILIGCVIPDVPWILQRLAGMIPDINPYDLRLYVTVQSSFFFCLILSLLLSTFSKSYWRTFLILSINSFLHLILDSLETKWGNGVHLIAPLNWNLINFRLFWPESIIAHVLTAFGILYFWLKWPESYRSKSELAFRPIPIFLISAVYVFLPFWFLSGPENADNHYVKTLRSIETRNGKYIELDRGRYIANNGKNMLITFAGEKLDVKGVEKNNSHAISIQGTFVTNHLVRVSNYHTHHVVFRNAASYVGLFLVAFYWICNILICLYPKIIRDR